jgi:excisionase family DNA binding protein
MTLPQAAEQLGMHRTRLWQMVKAGTVQAEKVGRDWLIDQGEVDRLKAAQAVRE